MSADDQMTPISDDDDDTMSDEHDQHSVEADAATPDSPAPRIVSETPLGGVPRPAASTPRGKPVPEDSILDSAETPDSAAETEEPPRSTGVPDQVSDSANVPPKESPLAEDRSRDRETVPDDTVPADLAQHMHRAMTQDEESRTLDTDSVPSTAEPPAAEPDTVQEKTDADRIRDEGEWDDEISPELASVLFAAKPAAKPDKPAAAAAEQPPAEETAQPAAESVPAAAPAPKPATPPAESIQLTSKAEARTLPITAEGHAAPAPAAELSAKVRYVRVEEPLKDDNGQHTEESWTYFKGAYPALDGRLVREVTIEQVEYADGSWKWTYERRYEDRGQDKREVRANADASYFEREDAVSVIDAEGKRAQYEEEAALIHAPPDTEEKHGGILGSLFGRDKDDDAASSAAVWRDATSAETKQARRDGGDAFDRSLLERLF